MTEAQVAKLREEHEEEASGSEASQPVFRVIEGVERKMTPKESVTKWRIL